MAEIKSIDAAVDLYVDFIEDLSVKVVKIVKVVKKKNKIFLRVVERKSL